MDYRYSGSELQVPKVSVLISTAFLFKQYLKMYIKWTEMARINLVETVIKVDAEKWRSCSGKWERILALLPAEFREKTWNASKKAYNVPKCKTMFSDLLHAYRCKLAGKANRMPIALTQLVCTVLKRYEDIRKGRLAIQTDECLRSGRLRGVKASRSRHRHIRSSADTMMGKWERVDSLLQGRTWNYGKGRYNQAKWASCFFKLREAYKAHLRQEVGKGSRESAKRLLSKPLLLLLKKHEDLSDIKATPQQTESSARLGAQTRARTRIETTSLCSSDKPPFNYSRGSSPMRKATSINTHSRCEGLHSNLDGPQSRLDREFSDLGKWVQEQLIPSGEKMANEVITSAIVCAKRRKLDFGTAAVPIGDPLHDRRSRLFSLRIRAWFQQLRVQFSEDLKNTSVEIAEVLLRYTH